MSILHIRSCLLVVIRRSLRRGVRVARHVPFIPSGVRRALTRPGLACLRVLVVARSIRRSYRPTHLTGDLVARLGLSIPSGVRRASTRPVPACRLASVAVRSCLVRPLIPVIHHLGHVRPLIPVTHRPGRDRLLIQATVHLGRGPNRLASGVVRSSPAIRAGKARSTRATVHLGQDRQFTCRHRQNWHRRPTRRAVRPTWRAPASNAQRLSTTSTRGAGFRPRSTSATAIRPSRPLRVCRATGSARSWLAVRLPLRCGSGSQHRLTARRRRPMVAHRL